MLVRHLLSLLILLGLVLAPAGMLGAPAMAMSGQAMVGMAHDGAGPVADHPCAEKQKQTERQAPDDCCVIACTAIPAVAGELAAHPFSPHVVPPLPLVSVPHGLEPEADPPPPRFS